MPSITSRKVEQSRRPQKRAESMIPGGVNSPVRAFGSVGGDPPFIVRGKGSHVWDADENEYIDYVGSWGPLILGHAAPDVLDAIVGAACNGTSFGASTPSEADLAELVLAHTSALGVRLETIERLIARRSERSARTPWGEVRVKVKHLGEREFVAPEYEDCARVARTAGVPLMQVYAAAQVGGI